MKRKTRIRIHREGHKILLVTCAVLIALNLFTTLYLKNPALNAVTVTMSVLLVGCFAYFFRLPHREFVTGNCQVIAPADGRIVVIEETYEQEYFKDKRIQVSIFMSPTNVHVNRSPISGVVTYQKYHPGKYLVAWHPKSSEKNERNTIVLEHEESDTEILIRQIAGKLARKIRWYFNEGDTVMQNAELGFIKFGSRVDMFLPLGTKIDVSLRQKVKGGVTVIGTLPENN
ncbi:MAG: phosphatidylserine decarboxylase family protein [Chitinophagales bacterium]|nr:phosphatidylserine decarboxylase family protein [Chitinophagales bacterium]MDW8418689.1 phosphatidylserine decarboxylase family protein [Chitinophagales bacterium]